MSGFLPSHHSVILHLGYIKIYVDFPDGSVVKNLPARAEDAGDVGLTPGLGRSAREGNCKPLQCSCLENHMDRRAWQAT